MIGVEIIHDENEYKYINNVILNVSAIAFRDNLNKHSMNV